MSDTVQQVTTSLKKAYKRFENVAAYVEELGGSNGHVIEKVLIANNGVAAVKAIRSIRRWAYDVFGDPQAIQFVVMATPEDLRANAEYIRMGDVIVDVPGGSNNHNYANVNLIIELARLHGVQAVWAGWGHASENPHLPDGLAKSVPPIKFIGPSGPPMRALGDKIASTIIAQTAGVPCIAWNGSSIISHYDPVAGCLPDGVYEKATVKTATEAYDAAIKIGFPVMIKASEGGGGKGIRRVELQEDVKNAYRQVCGEVPGSPIFIMKLSSNSRHLEVQLLADEYGNAIALNGRDCSVQRRHQKIIEEGPPIAAKPDVWDEMEKAAVALAKAVGYKNAGTVEYLYSESENKFYFLELNPRLQVEHPVTEMITRINLPAAQFQVAMGIPLYHIPEIRELYGEKRFEDDCKNGNTIIDFDTAERIPPYGHCIAVRITAENAEAGFKPTSGGIQELNFRSTPSVWGYFSMDSSGSIHEFADSQFGHLFANGTDREEARRNMVLALKELSIRGDISTTVDYISKLIELDDFVHNKIHTGWLDDLLRLQNKDESTTGLNYKKGNLKSTSLQPTLCALIGAAVLAYDECTSNESLFLDALQKGQLPSQSLLSMIRNIELILNGVKYQFCCTRNGQKRFSIAPLASPEKCVYANIRPLSDGGYLTEIFGKSHVAYITNRGDSAIGMRMTINGVSISFSTDYDPTSLKTDVAGKLVKKLVADGEHVKKGQAYCEVEVMKMFMPLKVSEAGIITWRNNEGASLSPGDQLAILELDNPENVETVSIFSGDLQPIGQIDRINSTKDSSSLIMGKLRPHLSLRKAFENLDGAMAGFLLSKNSIQQAIEDILVTVTDPHLPVYEIEEHLSVISSRIDPKLLDDIQKLILNHQVQITKIADKSGLSDSSATQSFPAQELLDLINNHIAQVSDVAERNSLKALTTPLLDVAKLYTSPRGSERALQGFLNILRRWIDVERWFCDNLSYADAVDNLRKSNKNNYDHVLEVCRAHSGLKSNVEIVYYIMDSISDALKMGTGTMDPHLTLKKSNIVAGAESLQDAMPLLNLIGSMGGNSIYCAVALRARKLLLQESLSSIEERKLRITRMISILSDHSENTDTSCELDSFINENVPLSDFLYPLMNYFTNENEKLALLELHMRKLYRTQTLKDVHRNTETSTLKFTFVSKSSETVFSLTTPVTSMTDLTRAISKSSSMNRLGELSDSESEGNLLRLSHGDSVPPYTQRTAVCRLFGSLDELTEISCFEELLASFPQYKKIAPKCTSGPANVLYIICMNPTYSRATMVVDELAISLQQLLVQWHYNLEQADVRRVSFVFNPSSDDIVDSYQQPIILTYRAAFDYKEDTLFRNIDPSHAYQFDLNRLEKNFRVESIGQRQTARCYIHSYKASPRTTALAKDKTANKDSRIFVRALSFTSEFSSISFEKVLVDALIALDIAVHENGSSTDNHLFLNLISACDETVLDPAIVEQSIVDILKRYSARIVALGLTEVETKLLCRLTEDSPPIALRMFASNPTGYVLVMNTYVEAVTPSATTPIFKLVGGTKASLSSSGDSSWEGLKVTSPYPLTRPFDAQRKSALLASDSLYCYDIPALFEAAIEQQWSDAATKGGIEGSIRAAARPLMVMFTSELVVKKKNDPGGPWTFQDYLSGGLELIQTQRRAGANDVGMVAWLMTLKTVEYPEGRQVVLIANDITYKAGSFGTREDVVFKLASDYAREHRIPRLYVAANSGARIGLSENVKSLFKVAFKDISKPENGFDFLYVSKDDYANLNSDKEQIKVEPSLYLGKEIMKITDIIGSEPDLGVENLKGSGLIAGETSSAYKDILTMTIVLGRTVGIGAYLVRLGQRTIQKQNASPIILTGYQALNKLMGVDVYSGNDQLGGPSIMYSNGISHLLAKNHFDAVKSAMEWLAFVPCVKGGLLPITDLRGYDIIERKIDFTPSPGVPYDPRYLLTGTEDDDGNWLSGFFDRGSFVETLGGWAKTVVVGRARLGGIPMGVIATENRTIEAITPADPADVKASEVIVQEAGCVWFPNSAYKTAQAIRDFNVEDLPLIIFANWRGFSGGQRDMFDEVLKYGSMIVDAFVDYKQPIFVFIPPFAEIRGGAWVVLDAAINPSVMEMYASSKTARGGVLEATGTANVKYRLNDLLKTMHRLDDELKRLDKELKENDNDETHRSEIRTSISKREKLLLPVYEQISVQFCELHDTPGRMKAVSVIEKEVEWSASRSFFFWRLRRRLAEFDLRKKMVDAGNVGRGIKMLSLLEAGALMKQWFVDTEGCTPDMWSDDKFMLAWMAQKNDELEEKLRDLSKQHVVDEVYQAMTAGGGTAQVSTAGILEGMKRAFSNMSIEEQHSFKEMLRNAFDI